jgi:serine/threonine-protein kinase
MSGDTPAKLNVLTLSDAERVDQVCDRFEAAWRAGDWPCIEGYLEAVTDSARIVLLRELLELEVELRLQAGERPTASEYRLRFAEHGELVDEILRAVAREPGGVCSTFSHQVIGHRAPVHELPTADATTVPREPERMGDSSWVDGPLGRLIGDYVILDRLGSGGMGVVYRALQRSARRLVALKLIKAEWWGESTDGTKREAEGRFVHEAQAHAQLEHDHIVPVYDVGYSAGILFLSMRLIKGRGLSQIVRSEGPLPPRRAAYYIEAVSRAIQHAHDHKILHRDIKPGNVMVDENDRPFVIDLGLAKSLEATEYTASSGKLLGTPEYMSPEQARGEGDIGIASDVYGLGATLFALLTGRPPFTGTSPAVVMRKVIEEDPAWPRERDTPVGRELKAICLKCLEKDPGRRFHSAGELACALNKYMNFENTGVTLPGPWTRLAKWVRR